MRLLIVFLSLVFSYATIDAQCMAFARKVGKAKLGDYIHDGNYNATILMEGEKAELFKTFFSGQRYRIAISKVEQLPDIHFRIIDQDSNVLFDNKEHNYSLVWDFEVESTQMLTVQMYVLEHEKKTANKDVAAGCVAVMFGVDMRKKKK